VAGFSEFRAIGKDSPGRQTLPVSRVLTKSPQLKEPSLAPFGCNVRAAMHNLNRLSSSTGSASAAECTHAQ
jgi:hypothetical protein